MRRPHRDVGEPGQWRAPREQEPLHRDDARRTGRHVLRVDPGAHAVRGDDTGCFADRPLPCVDAVGRRGDLGGTEVLRRCQEVARCRCDERPQRDLERCGRRVDDTGRTNPRVQVGGVPGDAHAVPDRRRASRAGSHRLKVLVGHGPLGAQPPRLPNIWRRGEPVTSPGNFGAQPQAREPATDTVVVRGLGLEPVQEGHREFTGLAARPHGLVDQARSGVVVADPVDDGDITVAGDADLGPATNPPIAPEGRLAGRSCGEHAVAVDVGVPTRDVQRERLTVPQSRVARRRRARVVLTGEVFHSEAPGDGLHRRRLGSARQGVRLAKCVATLGSGDPRSVRERQQVAELGGIAEDPRLHREIRLCPAAGELHLAQALVRDAGLHRTIPGQHAQTARVFVGREHRAQHPLRGLWLEAQPTDPPTAGVRLTGACGADTRAQPCIAR